MSGLIIQLRPHEQIMVNGVVLENGEKKSRLRIVTDNARIMRMRHAIDPTTATTPLKRAHYLTQQVISGEMKASDAGEQIRREITTGAHTLGQDTAKDVLQVIDQCIADDDFYRAMQYLRTKTAHSDRQ